MSTNTTPRKRKRGNRKEENVQPRLESFFASPTSTNNVSALKPGHQQARTRIIPKSAFVDSSPSSPVSESVAKRGVEVIDVDADDQEDQGTNIERASTAAAAVTNCQANTLTADVDTDARLAADIAEALALSLQEQNREQGFFDIVDQQADENGSEISKSTGSQKRKGLSRDPSPPPVKSAKRLTSPFGSPAKPEKAEPAKPLPDLTSDPLTFSVSSCPWLSKRTPYSFLAHTLSSLSSTRSRLAIQAILTNTLHLILTHDPPSLLPSLYLLSNSLAPPYVSVELGLGPSIISKSIQATSGLSSAAIRKLYTQTGDPGDVAHAAKAKVRTLVPHSPLTVHGVHESLRKIANTKGHGTVKTKQAIVEKLLVAAQGEEARYLVRTLAQHIRVGATRTTVLTALARAVVLGLPSSSSPLADVKPVPTKKGKAKSEDDPAREEITRQFVDAEALIRRIYVQHPNFDSISAALLQPDPLADLAERVPLTVGIPLHPTLGSPARSLEEVYALLGNAPFAAELKYDGQRAQVHATLTDSGSPSIKVFSRHLEDMTDKYPDVVLLAKEMLESSNCGSFILDAEIVAVDVENGQLKSFQELANRPRRAVKIEDVTVPVCVFAFDLLLLDGEVLLQKSFRERRTLLHTRFPPISPHHFAHVSSVESSEGENRVREFWMSAVEGRAEGLMIKLLDTAELTEITSSDDQPSKKSTRRKPLPATYEPDKRTAAWLKLKKDYVSGIGDSLDLVPIGAWHGNGRKAQWWSPVLLALWDPEAGEPVALCKCMSGFTDAFYKEMRDRYTPDTENCSREPIWQVETGGYRPEFYFRPHEVWEIRGADITLSPVSIAASRYTSSERGLSLRFPRFMSVRIDKGIEEASNPELLANMWKNQEARGRDAGGNDDGDLLDVDLEESDVPEEDDYTE